jgi:PAS domain S-box-containing protein
MTSVLVVEDDAIISTHIAETLERLGYEVPATADGCDEALHEVAAHHPDLVLMDVRLRGPIDGIETVARLRRTSDVPVIYLTAHTDEATLSRAKETAPHGYLVKPFNERDLRTAIEVAIHKHALEREIAVRERWFSTTLASLGDAVLATDPEERVTFMNPVAEMITGWTSEQARGRPLGEVFRLVDERGDPQEPPIRAAMRDRFTVALPPKLELVNQTGARRGVDDSAAPIVDDRGELLGGVIVFRDVTERRQLERRVEVAERLASLGTMASGIAHELNNPLAAVMGNVSFALEELGQLAESAAGGLDETRVAQCREALEDAAQGADRLRKIIDAMRWFLKRRSEKREVVDLPDLIEPALGVVRNTLQHKARVVRAYGTTPFVDVDEGQLVQVLVNLLTNAADAIPDARADANEIRISTFTDAGGRAVVEVRDSGAGIAEAELARVFEPFFSTKGVGSGIGLGLAICHSFVLAAGGELTVESQLGRGSTFRVSLPPAARGRVSEESVATALPVRRAKILLVDDEASVCRVIERLLPEHDLTSEGDARTALSRIASGETFDLVLCDLMMPILSGADVYQALKSGNPELAQRMIFLTGGTFTAKTSEFLEGIRNRVISKPFTADALRGAIAEALAGPR